LSSEGCPNQEKRKGAEKRVVYKGVGLKAKKKKGHGQGLINLDEGPAKAKSQGEGWGLERGWVPELKGRWGGFKFKKETTMKELRSGEGEVNVSKIGVEGKIKLTSPPTGAINGLSGRKEKGCSTRQREGKCLHGGQCQ